jgi:uncharacterized protein YfaS (alpha-2-macroglobulin family)
MRTLVVVGNQIVSQGDIQKVFVKTVDNATGDPVYNVPIQLTVADYGSLHQSIYMKTSTDECGLATFTFKIPSHSKVGQFMVQVETDPTVIPEFEHTGADLVHTSFIVKII